jgi:acyl-CoA synthetase (AMP-forming)/AMP-acid ligase II
MSLCNVPLFKVHTTTSIMEAQSSLGSDVFCALIEGQRQRLLDMGIARGDRILIYAVKSASYCALLLAIFSTGAIAVPIFPGLKATQLSHVITDCAPTVAFANTFMLQQLRSVSTANNMQLADIACDTILERTPNHCGVAPESELSVDDPAAIIYTSGSTGLPKGVTFSRGNLLLGARSVAQYTKLECSDCILCVLPFSFDAGLISFLSALVAGAKIVLADFVQASQLITLSKRWNCTSITAVPGLWTKITGVDWTSAGGSIKRICSTGGHLHTPLQHALQTTFPYADIYPMYGFTEAFRCAYMSPERAHKKPGSVGQSIPYASFAVISELGQLCGPDEVGELVQFGPLVTLGYWNNERLNEQKFRPVPASILHDLMSPAGDIYRCDPSHFDKVAWSGDLVRVDEDGDLTFVNRHDDMMKANGFRISPSEIEDACVRHGCLAAFAFVFHDQAHDLIAVACAGDSNISITTLKNKLCIELPNYMVPQHLHIIRNIPTNGNGKFDRAAIRKILASEVESQTC